MNFVFLQTQRWVRGFCQQKALVMDLLDNKITPSTYDDTYLSFTYF